MKLRIGALLTIVFAIVVLPAYANSNPEWATSITQSPIAVKAGQTVTFTAPMRVRYGPTRNLQVVGGVGATRILDRTFPVLIKDAQHTLSFKWKAVPGTHTAYFEIDPDQQAADSNRAYNRIELPVTVAPPARALAPAAPPAARTMMQRPGPGTALPDIALVSTRIVNATRGDAPGTDFYTGDRIQIELKLENDGQIKTGSFYVELKISRAEQISSGQMGPSRHRVLRKSVADLAPDDETTLLFDVGAEHVAHAWYKFEVKADYNNRVTEFNEDNNEEFVGNLGIKERVEQPDLKITLTSPDPERHIGRKVLLRGAVVNQGDAGTGRGIQVTLKCDGKGPKSVLLSKLDVGARATYEFTHRWSTRGTRRCTAEAWVVPHSTDKNDADNTASLTVRIK